MERCMPNRYWRSMIRFFHSKALAVSLFAVAVSAAIMAVSGMAQTVYITDGETTTIAVTAEKDYKKIVQAQNIALTSNDMLDVEHAPGSGFTNLTVLHGFSVKVTVDGATTTYSVTGGTVAELLSNNGIALGYRDHLSIPAEHALEDGDHITIVRVMTRTRIEKEVIYHEIVPKYTSVISLGRTRVLESGYNGERQYTYEDVIEDGEVVDSILLNTVVTKEPKSGSMLVGNGSAISGLDYSSQFPLDSSGIPLHYSYVLHDQHATGYYASAGAWGAAAYSSARNNPDVGKCVAGTVAVNPNIIPYGTRMYIRTADGSFVYGYAVANDTGTGMMQGLVDVDLFYESFLESQLNGRRVVDIYILD